MSTPAQDLVFDFIRDTIEKRGRAPTLDEIGQRFGYTPVNAHHKIESLIRQRRLAKHGVGKSYELVIVGQVDLRGVPTEAIRAELERRERAADAEVQDLAA
jgi:SOS-response transcriptional repressor LexA